MFRAKSTTQPYLYTTSRKRKRRGNSEFNFKPLIMLGFFVFAVIIFVWSLPKIFSNPFKKITIVDGYGEYTLLTRAKNVGEIYKSGILNMKESDSTVDFDTPVMDNMTLYVDRSIVVNVVSGGTNIKVRTSSGTAREILTKAGISFSETDAFNVPLDEVMNNGDTLVHAAIETKTVTKRAMIDFDTVQVEDNTLAKGKTGVIFAGEKGYKNISYLITYQDGVEISRVVASEKVIKEPISRKIAIGTKTEAAKQSAASASSSDSDKSSSKSASASSSKSSKTSSSGKAAKPVADVGSAKDLDPARVQSTKVVSITAYTHDGSLTASGTKPARGTVAVDPKQIPLGTKLYIPGYGYGVALDTGGAIKGNIIDIFLDSEEECIRWGRRSKTIYILKY